MISSERLALRTFGLAAAWTGSAALLVLAYVAPLVSTPTAVHWYRPVNTSIAARGSTLEQPHSPDRFAFVPVKAVPLLFPPPADQLPSATKFELVDPQSWSAEIHRDATPHLDVRRPPGLAPSGLPARTRTPGTAPAYTLTQRLTDIAPAANQRLEDKFQTVNVLWPPHEITLLAIKDEKTIEMFARRDGGEWRFIYLYRVLAASGKAGPKLRQGDQQVPEGMYGISFLNPNSRYHVSLRVNYPNAFDRQMAAKDGRHELGGDIMVHGKNVSIGCLAVGDAAAEELFVLAANVGLPKVKLIIAPTDFRRNGLPPAEPGQPAWLAELYRELAGAMSEFNPPPNPSVLSFFWK